MSAKNMKFTERTIARLPAPHPSGQQVLYWDSDLTGFGLRVSGVSSSKVYIAQRRLNGRTRRVNVGACNEVTLEEARDEAADFLHRMRHGHDPKAKRGAEITLKQALDDYLKDETGLRERSRTGYRYAIDQYLSAWHDRPVLDLTQAEVKARHAKIKGMVAERRAEKKHEVTGKSGAATADATMRVLGVLWNHAAKSVANDEARSLPRNPTLDLPWFRPPARKTKVKGDDLPAFYKAVDALPNRVHRDYLLLLLFTGMRRGEAASLRWADLDFATKTMNVSAIRTKANRDLDLPMTDFIYDLLLARQTLGREGEFVFPAESASGHIAEPRFALRLVAKACGIAVSVHDLRRTFISVAEATEMSVYALKALVNHAPGRDVTADYLGKLTAERLREPAQRVAKRLKELCGLAPAKPDEQPSGEAAAGS